MVDVAEPPVFALNGTYDTRNNFFVGVFQLTQTTNGMVSHTLFLGGNFKAEDSPDGELSVLSNTTRALLEYSPPEPGQGDADVSVINSFPAMCHAYHSPILQDCVPCLQSKDSEIFFIQV